MWSSEFIGRTDMNCWALVRTVYAQHCGISLPSYAGLDYREMNAVQQVIGTEAALPPWLPVKPFPGAERQFDVVIMRGWLPCSDGVKRRGIVHAGIVTRTGHVMHTDMEYAVVEVPLAHITVRGKLVACYRHEALGAG